MQGCSGSGKTSFGSALHWRGLVNFLALYLLQKHRSHIVPAALLVACAFFTPAAILRAQVGTTTDLVIGRVTGPDTLPLRGAHVDVTSVESGITRTKRTDDDGRFSVIFPDGGGQYVLTVHYLGMAPFRTLLKRQADEDRLVANVRLSASAVLLSAVDIRAARGADSLAGGAGASGQVLTREQLDQLGYLGNEAAALALITPGVSLLPGADSSLNSIAIGGQSPTQTGHMVDGAQSGAAALPREAVKSTSVLTSAYDVSYGEYTGGFVEQTTVSGTNLLKGSVTSSAPLAPLGGAPVGSGVITQRQSGVTVGGNLAGPLKKNHLFASGAVHDARTTLPSASIYTLDPATLGLLGVTPDSLDRFLQILNAQGMPRPASDAAGTREFSNRSAFGRIDFTPTEAHTFTLSANEYEFRSSGWANGPLATPLSGSEYFTSAWRGFVAATSHLGAWVNDARVSVSSSRYGTSPKLSAASGLVVVPSTQQAGGGAPSIATLTFGGNSYGSQITTSSTVDGKDELSRLSADGAHRVKIGAALTLGRASGGAPGNIYGTFRFNSLTDLASGHAASFSRTLLPADQSSGSRDAALYVGDAWRTGPKLQLIYGVRLEHTTFDDAPGFNASVASAFGLRTDNFPHETRLSPRVGFTYFYGATDKKPAKVTLRGGIGVFRSGAAQVASEFAAARDATGLPNSQAQLACVGGAVPALDWNYFVSTTADLPVACASALPSAVVSALPRVTVIDPSFEVPRTIRASLNASRQFARIWNVSLEGTFTNGYAETATRDINLVPSARFNLSDEASRPVYVASGAIVPATGAIALSDSRVNPDFGSVSLISSSLRSETRSASLSLGRNSPSLSVNGSYTRTFARTQILGMSGNGFFFGGSNSTAGDPRVAEWVRNPYSPPHQLRVFMSYRPKPWMEITPSLFAQTGYVFDPLVSTDVNGDGAANDRAFVFDPARTADTAVANGMRRLLSSAPSRIRDCLSSQLGRIAGAGSCETPWYISGAISMKFSPPWDSRRLSLSLQTNNALGGIDLLLHGQAHIHGWGQFSPADRTLLYVRGFDATSQRFKYAVNERFGVPNVKQNYLRQPLQLTLLAQMALGHMQQGGGMGMAGLGRPLQPSSRNNIAGAAGSTHSDTLRARIARTMPNVFRRVLALKDSASLNLTTEQVTRLGSLADAYQRRTDSLTTAIVVLMSTPVTGGDPTTIAARVRAKNDEGHALAVNAIGELRSVLREDQLKKLSAEVLKAQ